MRRSALRLAARLLPLVWLCAACVNRGGLYRRPVALPAPLVEALTPADVEQSVLLVGDAGEPGKKSGGRAEPVLRALEAEAGRAPERTTVVYLGDNIYPAGMPDSGGRDRRRAERIIDQQIDTTILRSVRRVFVPGNHDWNDQGLRWHHDGLTRVREQSRYIAAAGERQDRSAGMSPPPGCPGPEVLDLGSRLRVIVLDTEWWLQRALDREAAAHPGAACDTPGAPGDSAASIAALRIVLDGGADRHVVVVAHHPLVTGGEHGGYCPSHFAQCALKRVWARIRRARGASWQDIGHPANERMRATMIAVLAERPPLLYASGHDHDLQVLRGGGPPDAAAGAARYYAVSGAGIAGHESTVACLEQSVFAAKAPGFMRLDVLRDGRVALTVLTVGEDGRPLGRARIWLTAAAAVPRC